MSNSLGQTLSSFVVSAGLSAAILSPFSIAPLPNASSPIIQTSIIQEDTFSQNYYQYFFSEQPREQAYSFYGELRHFTSQEQTLYQEMIARASRPLHINISDLYK